MKLQSKTVWTVLVCLVFLFSPPSDAAPQGTVAKVENLGRTLVFHPLIEFNQIILTVTGPCDFQHRRLFKEGTPYFKLTEETIDGLYTYALKVIPFIDEEIIEVLKKAREIDDNSKVRALCREGLLPGDPAIQSDGFLVAEGEIVWEPGSSDNKTVEGPSDFDVGAIPLKNASSDGVVPFKDFVILDDLIVDGSACVGFDCVNGESFGFDTIRLKENNLRIKFDDTSTAASYPRNDWQLTANDSANGGASKFSIDDISGGRTPFTVEANARSHSLYVDDGGRIGSRTSTPSTEIHTIDGDTPTLRLQQDGTSGFAPQAWDVAGNETNFFIRDVTHGSTLPFRIRPGAPTSSIDVTSVGRVGLGTVSADAALEVSADATTAGTGNAALKLVNTAGDVAFQLDADDDGSFWNISHTGATEEFRISKSGTGTAEFILTSSGDLTIEGDLTVTGAGGCTGCDGMFAPGYPIESLEEHAAFMWQNNYLPDVGPTPEGTTKIQVFQKTTGILKELEKAHIYIEQLNNRLKEKDTALTELHERLARIEASLAGE